MTFDLIFVPRVLWFSDDFLIAAQQFYFENLKCDFQMSAWPAIVDRALERCRGDFRFFVFAF